MEIAALITLIDALVATTAKVVALVQQSQSGTPPTAEQQASAKQETADLLQKVHDLLPN